MATLSWRHLPNLITALRLGLVPPMAWLLAEGYYRAGFLVFVVAAASDGVDGLLARRFGWTSRFGAWADPAADKLLMFASYSVLALQGHIPFWVFALVIARDLVIVLGVASFRLWFGPVDMAPTRLSKGNTFLQILLVVLTVFALAWGLVPPFMLEWLAYAVGLSTLLSGADYAWQWGSRARAIARAKRVGKL
ncbi:MAG: CDP-alcohol phosphatidyltransferase family protein [Gammaproteobacteria bacterium]|nr:CDP-alcohol phosphatidyltransferase family protein [Gammaproteobacteria bacterium]